VKPAQPFGHVLPSGHRIGHAGHSQDGREEHARRRQQRPGRDDIGSEGAAGRSDRPGQGRRGGREGRGPHQADGRQAHEYIDDRGYRQRNHDRPGDVVPGVLDFIRDDRDPGESSVGEENVAGAVEHADFERRERMVVGRFGVHQAEDDQERQDQKLGHDHDVVQAGRSAGADEIDQGEGQAQDGRDRGHGQERDQGLEIVGEAQRDGGSPENIGEHPHPADQEAREGGDKLVGVLVDASLPGLPGGQLDEAQGGEHGDGRRDDHGDDQSGTGEPGRDPGDDVDARPDDRADADGGGVEQSQRFLEAGSGRRLDVRFRHDAMEFDDRRTVRRSASARCIPPTA